jgi:hypothetical protein
MTPANPETLSSAGHGFTDANSLPERLFLARLQEGDGGLITGVPPDDLGRQRETHAEDTIGKVLAVFGSLADFLAVDP